MRDQDELTWLVYATRTRMLFSQVPVIAPVGGVFAVLLAVYVLHLNPKAAMVPVMAWSGTTCLVSCVLGWFAVRFLRSDRRQAPNWRRALLLGITTYSVCWAMAVWVMPMMPNMMELRATLVGALIGVAACGAFSFTADRQASRLFFMPLLVSAGLFCADHGGVRALFGVVSIFGFISALWFSADRAHRRTGELLRLRFESDRLAALRASALEEAQNLAQAKGMFLATMSHEMRTPLHGILGLSRMLREEVQGAAAQHRIDLIQSAGNHLLDTINKVLDYSRIRARGLVLQKAPLDLGALLRQVSELAEANAQGKPVTVRFDDHLPNPCWIVADGHRLSQILHNLMGNAVKFTDAGQVTLRAQLLAPSDEAPAQLCFEVSDTGPGIPREQLERIFEPFYQVDGDFDRRVTGTGLGLSISSQICRAMDGRLSCQSTPGQGSTFRCLLPCTPYAAPHTEAAAVGPSPSSVSLAGHVLLVEDDAVNTMVAQAELTRLGLTVTALENGHEALAWLSSNRADIVLMDCHMPEMGGLEATRRIRAENDALTCNTRIPIVALTASTEPNDRAMCIDAGMTDFLAKPFSTQELTDLLQRYLGRVKPSPFVPACGGA